MTEKNTERVSPSAQNKTTEDTKKTDIARIRQNSNYNEEDLPAPNNNLFWERTSNPLSSKGN